MSTSWQLAGEKVSLDIACVAGCSRHWGEKKVGGGCVLTFPTLNHCLGVLCRLVWARILQKVTVQTILQLCACNVVTWPMNASKAGGDLALIQTSRLLFSFKRQLHVASTRRT